MAALTAGVPMIRTPMGRDQHAVAACVERHGLGVVVPLTALGSAQERRRDGARGSWIARAYAGVRRRALDADRGLPKAIDVLEGLNFFGPVPIATHVEGEMTEKGFAERFADEWIGAWNSHDLDRILAHYEDDFEMFSPVITTWSASPRARRTPGIVA